MRVITFYLPQFHEIKENNEWWGEGFTEWVNVKKAIPLYKNHYQPRVPQDNFYYNLLDVDVLRWQAKIASENNIHGFCFYHYWFNGKQLLEKPAKILLKNPDIKINYCFSWANEAWTNQWISDSKKILMEQEYGRIEDWRIHFEYLLPFFKDVRYIKEKNKPLFILYRPELIGESLKEMMECFNDWAIEEGFDGITFVQQHVYYDDADNLFDYQIEYQPSKVLYQMKTSVPRKRFKSFVKRVGKFLLYPLRYKIKQKLGVTRYSYDELWDNIISDKLVNNKSVAGGFVDWDNTPRKGSMGFVVEGADPVKFENYFRQLVQKNKKYYPTDLIFLFAWNEWAEGGYLEPDQKFGDKYLKTIKKIVEEESK